MTQKEIFVEIALSIRAIFPNEENFKEAVLDIIRLAGTVELTGYYISEADEKKWLDIFNINLSDSYIHELYTITQTQPPIHTNWNRAKFILYPDNKVNIKYIWDQALQDAVDKYNKESQA
jgi:hypothetical protein